MATGLQYKENLTVISGGYAGEGIGSNGVVQNWTDTSGDSGSSTVKYWYHDSAQTTDVNSTLVEVTVTDTWTATKDANNTIHVTVHTVLDSIVRSVVGSPSPLSTSIFVRRNAGDPNIWTSGGCVNAAIAGTYAASVDLGTYTIDLPPGHETDTHGTIYYRSNVCGYDYTNPPSQYIDEYWLGINFRNVLPPEYIPGKVRDAYSDWLSHNRATNGHAKIFNGTSWGADMKTVDGGVSSGDPPEIRHSSSNKNMRKVGKE